MEELQANDGVEDALYEKCVEIITTYFEMEDGTDGMLDYGFGGDGGGNVNEDGTFSFGVNNDNIGDNAGPYSF